MKIDLQKSLKRYIEIPRIERVERALYELSFIEKVLFSFFLLLLVTSTLLLLWNIHALISTEVPARGGSLHEGVIGYPRFLNPVLAISDADRDITSLVYSGLLKATPDGRLVPDLAESIEVSGDGLEYTVVLKENIFFHDGKPVDATDVVFTVQKALDPLVKSPKRANWEGVGVEKIDERAVRFTLLQPYAPFLENLTLGILPQHIWEDIPAEQFPFSRYNTEAVGSGPYVIENISKNSQGIPNRYSLSANTRYAMGEPYIARLNLYFFSTEADLISAYARGALSAASGISTARARALADNGMRIETYPLPRVFAVFFNQNQAPLFADENVRRALALATDKERMISEVFGEYATVLEGPVPAGSILDRQARQYREGYTERRRVADLEAAVGLLEKDGWQKNEEDGIMEKSSSSGSQRLAFTLTISSAPELKEGAELLARMWQELGADVSVSVFEAGNLNQEVIRPRQYDALLFGEIIGRDLDLYPFWHSSQRNDPGLNVALYTNSRADRALENIRQTSDEEERLESYLSFEEEVAGDTPAIFLFSPDFIYVVPKNVKGLSLGTVTTPAERFLNIHEWYIKTDRIWNIFID